MGEPYRSGVELISFHTISKVSFPGMPRKAEQAALAVTRGEDMLLLSMGNEARCVHSWQLGCCMKLQEG
eukprot:366000-Chlamydomonas_euryale.AAC.10